MDAKTCFYCSEPIEPGTAKCPFCGEALGKRDLARLKPAGWGSPEKPMTIAVIGWLCVIFGGFGVLGILSNVLMSVLMGSNAMFAQAMAQSWGAPGSVQRVAMFVLTGLGAIASILTLAAGVGLLRMRLWGRNVAVGVSIYSLVVSLVGPIFTMPAALEQARATGMETFMIVILAASLLISWVAYGLIIFFLLRPHVGAALRRAAGGDA